ncbi:hypothetical protein C2845_PM11G02510 [Panicum miliaceum]|uniref:Uncharacterized protein n=1 Tax=Panicum miliaceum TaxID=4540 RepID=A0A3L6RNA4_PANMI|nr:hypothetical protein C2845_PM11G02510 [Panicum miliaceum]
MDFYNVSSILSMFSLLRCAPNLQQLETKPASHQRPRREAPPRRAQVAAACPQREGHTTRAPGAWVGLQWPRPPGPNWRAVVRRANDVHHEEEVYGRVANAKRDEHGDTAVGRRRRDQKRRERYEKEGSVH